MASHSLKLGDRPNSGVLHEIGLCSLNTGSTCPTLVRPIFMPLRHLAILFSPHDPFVEHLESWNYCCPSLQEIRHPYWIFTPEKLHIHPIRGHKWIWIECHDDRIPLDIQNLIILRRLVGFENLRQANECAYQLQMNQMHLSYVETLHSIDVSTAQTCQLFNRRSPSSMLAWPNQNTLAVVFSACDKIFKASESLYISSPILNIKAVQSFQESES